MPRARKAYQAPSAPKTLKPRTTATSFNEMAERMAAKAANQSRRLTDTERRLLVAWYWDGHLESRMAQWVEDHFAK